MKVLKKGLAMFMALVMMVSVSIVETKDEVKAEQVDYTVLAQDFALDNNWKESWITADDDTEQWYRVNVPADGKVIIKIMAYMRYMNYALYSEDLSKTIQSGSGFYGTETAPKTETIDKVLSAGTYYLKISKDGSTGKYRISGTYENYGANDGAAYSFDSPQGLPENSVITGALTEIKGEDWYCFSISSPGVYTIKTVSYQRYLDFHLYSSDMTKTLASASYYYGSETAPATKTFDVTLSPGNYYIKINKGDCGKYLVSWTKLTQASCTHDYNNTHVYATYLSGGYTKHVCTKCGHTYCDSYTPKSVLGTPGINSLYKTKKKKCFYLFVGYVSNAKGYQVRYSTDKKMKKGVKTKTYSKYGNKKISGLKRRKKYYVQVRAYTKVGKKKVYSKWSAKKSIKTN